MCKVVSRFMLGPGLIDEGETAQQAALRELHEETGFIADEILQVSPIVVADPGKYSFVPVFAVG